MGLRTIVEELKFRVRPLPEHGATEQLAASLPPVEGAIEAPQAIDLNSIAEKYLDDLRRGEQISVHVWDKVVWCLWTTNPSVADSESGLRMLLDRVTDMLQQRRKRPFRQLASAYLTQFAIDRPRLEEVSRVLRSHASIVGEPWESLQAKYSIFDGAAAAEKIARLALRDRTNIQHLLRSEGAGSSLLEAGFANAVHNEGLKILCSTPVTGADDRVDTVRQWSLDGERLIFDCKHELARAVVLPFGQRIPEPTDRDIVLNFIIGLFGDPRSRNENWIGMDDVARILRRWLIGLSLRQFLDVVDKIAPDHMWKYRRAFWQAFHKDELLQNAWVIFGEDGSKEAWRMFGKDVPFGEFISGGKRQIEAGHAVLLLDFGQCIVADWSHNGRCNIWRKSDRTRPTLNAEYYTTDDVMRALPTDRTEANLNQHDIFTHVSADNYVWQDRVAERLRQLIHVRIPQSAYRVR